MAPLGRTGYLMIIMMLSILLLSGCISPKTESKPASVQPLDTSKITAVKAKFAQVGELAGAGLKVTVVNRECTIEGVLPGEDLKKKAEDLALSVEGIEKVINKIEVKP